ncbi:hypothetical protein EV363DRAFT_806241 [Boletus edulis]|nr:hypothetical protein EV363DRAFT_806241 [Boletus edulis]
MARKFSNEVHVGESLAARSPYAKFDSIPRCSCLANHDQRSQKIHELKQLRPNQFRTMADTPTLSVTLLGAGQEVGRSCCVLQYRGKTIVCDAGIHPAYSGMASLPFVDELDWSTVDAYFDHALSS